MPFTRQRDREKRVTIIIKHKSLLLFSPIMLAVMQKLYEFTN